MGSVDHGILYLAYWSIGHLHNLLGLLPSSELATGACICRALLTRLQHYGNTCSIKKFQENIQQCLSN